MSSESEIDWTYITKGRDLDKLTDSSDIADVQIRINIEIRRLKALQKEKFEEYEQSIDELESLKLTLS